MERHDESERRTILDREGLLTGGEEHFLGHVDERCMLVFAQMRGIYPRAEVAASARDPKRWSNLRIADAACHQPTGDIAFLSYEARANRESGEPYRALIGSGYVRREAGWKLAFHQHSALEPEQQAWRDGAL
jgi:hypothetical protein